MILSDPASTERLELRQTTLSAMGLERICRTVSHVFDVPIVLISVIDANGQLSTSCIGLEGNEVDECASFTERMLLEEDACAIDDAASDPRYANTPVVARTPCMRFYAGQSLRGPAGRRLGALVVIDRVPRAFDASDRLLLRNLAGWVETELHCAEISQALRMRQENEAHIRLLMESVADAIVTFDDQGIIRDANPAAERLFACPKDEMVGMTVSTFIGDAQVQDDLTAILRGALAPHRLLVTHREVPMRRSDGDTFEAEVSIREVPRQRQFVATLRDVTERRRIQVNQSRLAAIINSSDDAIIAKRLDETITDWNPAAERLYGYTAAEVLGRSIDLIIPLERREENRELTRRVGEGQSVARFETVRVHKDGSRRDISLSISPIRDGDGNVIGAAVIGHDISAQKRMEEQMRQALERQQQAIDELKHLNRLKSDFVSIVSHEFRTPLTGIMGFSEVLRDEQLTSEEVVEYAGDIHKDAERLARLINDMLDLDRLESGRISLHLEPVDINAVVRDVAAQFRGFSSIHSIKLELAADLPMIFADRDKLTQALTNFVSNAIKYSPGGGDVLLSTHLTENTAEVTVRDVGMGIPSDALDVIFERYARVESSGARHIQGTGLGLPIVRQIARLHGGDAWAESELGRGSTFHLRLPVQAEGMAAKENG